MPWCPKCKSEYRDGFTVCADCGSELVSDGQFEKLAVQERVKEQRKEKPEPATQTQIGRQEVPWPETEELSVRGDGQLSESDGQDGAVQQESGTQQGGQSWRLYQDSAERADENRFSAWLLLAVGSLGLLFIALGITGIVPLRFSNGYLVYGVMAAVFILFWVAGIVSMKNARIFSKRAESENSLRSTMLDWCRENLHAEELDGEIRREGNLPETEEIWYFRRFEHIKAKLNYQFVNLDQDFLDRFIDDCVYETVYGRNQ